MSHHVQSGIDLLAVRRITGHKTLQMAVRYAYQEGKHIPTAMDKLQQRLTKQA